MNFRYRSILKTAMWAVLLVCLLCQLGFAATYYVSTTGDDTTGDGSKANPWLSINKGDALQVLQPGDTVVVAAGTYTTTTGYIFKFCSGTATQPITYIAQGKVVLDATPATANKAVVTFTYSASPAAKADYNIFDGFELVGGKRSLDILGQGTATALDRIPIGVVIRNCIIRDACDAVNKTGAYAGQMVRMNTTHACEFYNNIVAITNPVRIDGTSTASGAPRAINLGNTAFANKIYNNTIYIDGGYPGAAAVAGPGPGGETTYPWTPEPKAVEGGGYYQNMAWNNAYAVQPDWVQLAVDGSNVWIVAAPGYENQLKNNIIWVKNSYTYSTGEVVQGIGIWDYTIPYQGDGVTGHSVGLDHANNAFSPAEIPLGEPNAGLGGLFYITDFLLHSEPWPGTGWTSCPWPETTYPHFHTYKNNDFGTNSLAFVDPVAVDFRLVPGSPCIDAGVDVGLPYYGSAPDVGAIEYVPSAYAASSIGDALSKQSGSAVSVSSVIVTVGSGVLKDNVIYVEDESRASGVAVKSSSRLMSVAAGQRVDITGTLDKTGAQPILNAVSIKLAGGVNGGFASETALAPLGTVGKSVCSNGLDNTGLLATIWGKVTFKAADDSYFCIDDGSGMTDGNGNAGVPVVVSDLVTPISPLPDPATNPYVAVTGVLGKKDCGAGVVPVIRPQAAGDIQQKN